MRNYKRVYIEITNICNLNCSFCIKTNRPKAYMSLSQFQQIARQVSQVTKYVYLHVMGEPLLHPQLSEFLATAHQVGLKVNLTTNGRLLKQQTQTLLSSPALHRVNISIHSFESQNGLCAYLDEVICFAQKASRLGILCSLRLWNTRQGKLPIVSQKTIAYLAQTLHSSIILQNGNFSFNKYFHLQIANQFDWPDLSKQIISQHLFCHGLRDHFGILVDGTVVPCCLDHEGDIPLGNLLQQNLKEILSSPRATNFYNHFSNRRATEELCQKCSYATRF